MARTHRGVEMSRIVTFGEIMLRLGPPDHERLMQAGQLEVHFGGAEANVAVAIAQLGGDAEFVTKLPHNEIGDRCIAELRRHGVGTSAIARGGRRMGIYFVENGASQRAGQVIYDRAGSAFAEVERHDFNWERIFATANWFHWSGITPAVSEASPWFLADALRVAKKLGLTVSFDMNYRAKLWTAEQAAAVLSPLLPSVDVLVCGLDEARSVFRVDANEAAEAATALREKFGLHRVLVPERRSDSASRTSWSATLLSDGELWTSRVHEIEIVDRVGAGDALTGALIFALLRNDPGQRALDFAVAASALKHTIPGDFNLVSLAEVEALAAGGHGGRVRR